MRKRKSSKPFSGYMTFPIKGTSRFDTFEKICDFAGDFADPVKRHAIFKKKRKFRLFVSLFITDEQEYEEIEITLPVDGVNQEQLARILYHHAARYAEGMVDVEQLDLDKSSFKITF